MSNNYIIQHDVKEHHIDFRILESTDGEPHLTLSGYIKFDGCSHWDTGDSLLHLCGVEAVEDFYAALKQCFKIAKDTFQGLEDWS